MGRPPPEAVKQQLAESRRREQETLHLVEAVGLVVHAKAGPMDRIGGRPLGEAAGLSRDVFGQAGCSNSSLHC